MASSRFTKSSLVVLAALVALLAAPPAHAQIKEPGSHPKYSVELEPHFVIDWSDEFWGGDGIGIGGRASIPVIDNGPVSSINNNLAIGFGIDWAHFSGNCWNWGPWWPGPNPPPNAPPRNAYNCSGDNLWFPIDAQWNFFFTPVVTAFGEAGLAIRYSHWSAEYPGCGNLCEASSHDIGVDPVFAVGGRFLLARSFGLTIRLGWPYLSLGASFLL